MISVSVPDIYEGIKYHKHSDQQVTTLSCHFASSNSSEFSWQALKTIHCLDFLTNSYICLPQDGPWSNPPAKLASSGPHWNIEWEIAVPLPLYYIILDTRSKGRRHLRKHMYSHLASNRIITFDHYISGHKYRNFRGVGLAGLLESWDIIQP